MSNVINVMKPRATQSMSSTSSCVGLIQAFTAWMGCEHAAIGTEGKCQEIQR